MHQGRALSALDSPDRAAVEDLGPWYLAPTDLELNTRAAIEACAGRAQAEINFDEAKELGLGHYQGRSGSGV